MGKKKKWQTTDLKDLKKALKDSGALKETKPPTKADSKAGLLSDLKSDLKSDKKPEIEDTRSEDEIFLEAMTGVREINGYRDMQEDKKPQPRKFKKKRESDQSPDSTPDYTPDYTMEELQKLIEKKTDITLADTDEYDEWVPKGGTASLTARLHRGECSIQDYIDLHGLIEDEAEAELLVFIEDSRNAGLSCIKIIHGRGLRSPGEPVLKNMVKRLLRGALSKHVRAYASAPQRDGGLGATYVLLRGR